MNRVRILRQARDAEQMTRDAMLVTWQRVGPGRLGRRERVLRWIVDDDERFAVGIVAVSRMQRGGKRQRGRNGDQRDCRDAAPPMQTDASHDSSTG